MPPTEDNQDVNITTLAVTLGRVEAVVNGVNEKVDKLGEASKEHGDTLSRHEVDIQLLKSQQRPRQPWYNVVAGITGIVAGLGAVITLIVLLSKFAQVAG